MTDDVDVQANSDSMRALLASEHARLSEAIEELEARKAAIREALILLGSGDAGPLTVTVMTNRRVNVKRFEEAFPYEEHPGLYVSKPDVRAARAKLGEDAVAPLLDEVGSFVRITEAKK